MRYLFMRNSLAKLTLAHVVLDSHYRGKRSLTGGCPEEASHVRPARRSGGGQFDGPRYALNGLSSTRTSDQGSSAVLGYPLH